MDPAEEEARRRLEQLKFVFAHVDKPRDRNWAHWLGGFSLLAFLFGVFWVVAAFFHVAKG